MLLPSEHQDRLKRRKPISIGRDVKGNEIFEPSLAETQREMGERRSLYRRLWDSLPLDAKGMRLYLIQEYPIRQTQADKDATGGRGEFVAGRTLRDCLGKALEVSPDTDRIVSAGWARSDVDAIDDAGYRRYRITLLIPPDRIDAPKTIPPAPRELAGTLSSLEHVEFAEVVKYVRGVAREHKGVRFISNLEETLKKEYGIMCDTDALMNQLIDAKVGEWQPVSGGGATGERFVLLDQ